VDRSINCCPTCQLFPATPTAASSRSFYSCSLLAAAALTAIWAGGCGAHLFPWGSTSAIWGRCCSPAICAVTTWCTPRLFCPEGRRIFPGGWGGCSCGCWWGPAWRPSPSSSLQCLPSPSPPGCSPLLMIQNTSICCRWVIHCRDSSKDCQAALSQPTSIFKSSPASIALLRFEAVWRNCLKPSKYLKLAVSYCSQVCLTSSPVCPADC
jgi:hypothetical protein